MITKDDNSRIIDIFDGGVGESLTKSFFDFCCRHSESVSFVLHNEAIYTASHYTQSLKNKMESAVSRMIKKYNTNEDGYVNELRRTHSIENKSQFDEYIEKIRKDNNETLRQLDLRELPTKGQDSYVELKKLGMTERKVLVWRRPTYAEQKLCFFPVSVAQKYLNEATDIFQFPIMIGEFEFEDWTFYRKDSAIEDNTFASATSHEGQARLWLTISENEEFQKLGFPQSILHKVYPPTSGKNAIEW